MALVRWDPTRELASMEIDRLNRMFTDLWGASHGCSGNGVHTLDASLAAQSP